MRARKSSWGSRILRYRIVERGKPVYRIALRSETPRTACTCPTTWRRSRAVTIRFPTSPSESEDSMPGRPRSASAVGSPLRPASSVSPRSRPYLRTSCAIDSTSSQRSRAWAHLTDRRSSVHFLQNPDDLALPKRLFCMTPPFKESHNNWISFPGVTSCRVLPYQNSITGASLALIENIRVTASAIATDLIEASTPTPMSGPWAFP